ncbi:8-demethyl-8-(2-methoxy-alpha-L-rhamnosyl)-tetracenomycin-C 3'-O-methyltransferase like protein [Verticillium longisporum]|nr:8-demethyl-8-(2-methoxy-alpha-L-rhamnosyl)-tetracenomycin-C 3'-O-methyltransferase like protein [Verticillium longisporum]CRK25796.1 hypothetical protein BN1708_014316 [Verticillium longisporum]
MKLKSQSQTELRAVFVFAIVTCIFMIYTFTRRPIDGIPTKASWGWKTADPFPDPSLPRLSFRDIALQYGSHKATTTKHHFMYEKYLPAIRDRHVKVLEIGLGCETYHSVPDNSPYPLAKVGASYRTFTSYFPHLSLTYLEIDETCAKEFATYNDKAAIFIGDQGDQAFLDRFVEQATVHGLFDVVIDDGAGTDDIQEHTLRDLWRIVSPGGVYFVEGVRRKSDRTHRSEGQRPFGDFVDELLWEDAMLPEGEIRSIDCMEGICAFFKKDAGMI